MMKRILIDAGLIILVFFAPWWIVLLAASAVAAVTPSFFEILFLGIFIDSLYNAPTAGLSAFHFLATISAACIFAIIEVLRRKLRFNR